MLLYDLNGTSSEEEEEEEEQEPAVAQAVAHPAVAPTQTTIDILDNDAAVPSPPQPPPPAPQQLSPPSPPAPAPAAAAHVVSSSPRSDLGGGAPVRIVLHESLASKYPNLGELLVEGISASASAAAEAATGGTSASAGNASGGATLLPVDVLPATAAPSLPPLSAHWVRNSLAACSATTIGAAAVCDRLPRACLMWGSADVMRQASDGSLLPSIVAAQEAWRGAWLTRCTLSLVVVGKAVAGLERVLDALQLEAGISCRRATDERELCALLTRHGQALVASERAAAKGGAGSEPAFLAGLTSSDVLRNKGVPKTLPQAWLGALKQILPEAHACAVRDAFPSFRRLYAHLARSEAEGGKLEGTLAELRVQGGKRLGPARAKRLARVLMATRHEADALVL
jgi:hypothetical protein